MFLAENKEYLCVFVGSKVVRFTLVSFYIIAYTRNALTLDL